jgi:hypothetical protein
MENLPSQFAKITQWLKGFLPWSLPIKLILGAALGALGSAGFLGFLSEYATYGYAIYYGIRPPLEGIPYLQAAVTLGSIFLLLSGAAVFLFYFLYFRFFLWLLNLQFMLLRFPRHTRERTRLPLGIQRARRLPFGKKLLLAAGFSALSVLLMIFLSRFEDKEVVITPQHYIIATVAMIVVALMVLIPRFSWWIAAALTLAYLGGSISIMFRPTKYSEFLRYVGYGGGLSVTMELTSSFGPQPPEQKMSYLMLRTTKVFILYDKEDGEFVEIPLENVRAIRHNTGRLHKLTHVLPDVPDLVLPGIDLTYSSGVKALTERWTALIERLRKMITKTKSDQGKNSGNSG